MMTQCTYHPDRIGIGVCMRCRAVICAECCTRLDGINHCHACLGELGQRPTPRRRQSSRLSVAMVLGLIYLAFVGMLWLAQGSLR